MRMFRDMPIKRKLMVIIALTSGLALLLSGVSIVIADSALYRRSIQRDLEGLAQVVADNSTAALAFENSQDAQQTLATLRARTYMVQACIYTVDSKVFARYARPGSPSECPKTVEAISEKIAGGNLFLFRPILLNDRKVGSLYFHYDLGEIASRQKLYLVLVIGIALVSMLFVSFLSSRLQRLISLPIANLAASAQSVSETKDYSIRAEKQGEDELGLLVDSFNEMLTTIQERDAELQRAHDQLEHRVIERTAQLEVANKELESFSYSVSHDLRAPLRAIDGFSRLVLEDYGDRLDEEGKSHLQRVCAASQRMGELIDDMLSLSRVSRNRMTRETVDLSGLADAVIAELRREEPGRSIQCTVEPGLRVEADSNLIRVVLENLLRNAWKFTRNKQPAKIEMGALQQNGKPTYFVRDNGAGFDMAYANKLFGAFQRLHKATEFEGTGIGLATVQRIVNRHGGKVWAEGIVEQGATFYFTLQFDGGASE
jgi:signal transduction histidine kinase